MRENILREKFLSCYDEVFDENGEIKPCGRLKCMELIDLAEKLCPDCKSKTFGNLDNGFIEKEAIKELKNRLSS